jgi:hypothetical protein
VEFVTGSTRNGSIAANTHQFTGSVLMSGSVGIGTSSPNFNNFGNALSLLASSGYGGIEVYGSGSNNGGQIDFGSGNIRYASVSGEFESSTNGFLNIRTRRAGTMTDAVRITSAGNVGIGKSPRTTGGITLDVAGGIQSTNDSGNSSYINFGQYSDPSLSYTYMQGDARSTGFLKFHTNDTERMRITSAGNVGIGTSSPSAPLHIVGNQFIAKSGGGGTYKQTIVGQTTATTSGVAKKVAYVGHTHSVIVYVWATQSTSSGVSVIANITTSYGAFAGGVTYSSGAMGTVSAVAVNYNNGGSPAYTIDITVTYSGAAPTINYVIEGISHDNAIYTL